MSVADGSAGQADGRRWIALGIGTFAQAMFSAVFVVVPVLLPFLQTRFDLSVTQVGLALAAVNLGMALSLVPWGQLADQIGERPVIVLGLAGASAGFAAAALAPSLAWLLLALVCAGALGASVNAASTRAVMGWFAPMERGLAFGIRQTAIPLGGATFALVLPPLAVAGGSASGFYMLAGAMAVAALASTALPTPPAPTGPSTGAATHPLRDRRVWRIAAAGGVMICGQSAMVGYVVLFLHDRRGVSTAGAAAVLAAGQLLGALLLIAAGRWSDRVGRRLQPLRLLNYVGGVAILLVALAACAPLALLMPAAAVASAVSMSWVALCSAAAGENAGPARSGAAMGLQQAMMAVAATVAPIGFGALIAVSGWSVAFAGAAAAPVVGALLLRGMAEAPVSDR